MVSVPAEALERLRLVAQLETDDVAAWTTIGSTSAAAILAELDTLAAIRAYLHNPSASLNTLRTLLRGTGVETLEFRRAPNAEKLDR